MSEAAGAPKLCVLGPLEVRVGGAPIALGGRKQRAVLATLLLRANQVVSVDQLIDEVWGEQPPATSRHTLEVYVSRLRAALRRLGDVARLVARPPGYVLVVEPDRLDALRFEGLLAEARRASTQGQHRRASQLFQTALGLWRGPVLEDVELGARGRVEADRLDGLRVGALEEWAVLELLLGHHAALVPQLEALIAEHPFREGLRGSLMLALYRSGRRAEALDVYHKGRRTLTEELGLEAGRELQRLAGLIIRQDPSLDAEPHPESTVVGAKRAHRSGRLILAGVVAVAASAAAAMLVVLADSSDPASSSFSERAPRIAVVIPGGLGGADEFPLSPAVWKGVEQAADEYSVETELIDAGRQPDDWQRTLERVAGRRFDLVIVGLSASGPALAAVARRHPEQRSAFLDGSVAEIGRLPNVTGVVFAEHEAGYLAGYLAGLMEQRSGARLNPDVVVSSIGAVPVPAVERYLAGFRAGVMRASPEVAILGGYTNNFVGQQLCGRLANRQIDRGSDIVFAVAGPCGFGAMSAASVRGVWAIGVDGDMSYLGPHVLASATKRLDRAVQLAIQWFVQDRLEGGSDIVLDLNTNGVGLAGISPEVPDAIRDELARVDAAIRAGEIIVPVR